MLEVRSWIEFDSSITSKSLMIKIKETYGIELSITTAYRIIKRLNYSYITPRPTHYKQDKDKVEKFKKNLTEKVQKNHKRIFFFDEARFGTNSKVGHGWFFKGSRTEVKVKLGFKNFYLYSAVEVDSGSSFTLHLPYVNTECMQIFLDGFTKEVGGEEVIIIMDGAGWHKSKALIICKSKDLI